MIVYRTISDISRSRRYRAMSESRSVAKRALNSKKGNWRAHIAGSDARQYEHDLVCESLSQFGVWPSAERCSGGMDGLFGGPLTERE